MGSYGAEVHWQRGDHPFVGGRYSRRHSLHFDGSIVVPGSASPLVVPSPWSTPDAVDPEEAFVAALSACHMLWFLSLAAASGVVVDAYVDRPHGTLAAGPDGRMMMTEIVLRPELTLASPVDVAKLLALHDAAHERCFIAASIRSEVRIEPAPALVTAGAGGTRNRVD
jgi:organic hydroperoxide reductase OsmC/OhrA